MKNGDGMGNLKKTIIECGQQVMASSRTITPFRDPIFAFASAADPLWDLVKAEITGATHKSPQEWLVGAQTVAVFFLPFDKPVIDTIRKQRNSNIFNVPEWAVAYREGNWLVQDIGQAIVQELQATGVHAFSPPPTSTQDSKKLSSQWSHKSAAYIAGLGTFGINHLLITKAGCAGRLGSIITTGYIPPTKRPVGEYCLYKRDSSCGFCTIKCPTGALTVGGYDASVCSTYCELRIGLGEPWFDAGCSMCSRWTCAYFESEEDTSV